MSKIFEISTGCSQTIKTLMETVKEFVTDLPLNIVDRKENGIQQKYIYARISDQYNTLYVDIRLEGKEFTTFNCSEQEYKLNFNMDAFYNGILHSIEKDDIFTMRVLKNMENKLMVELLNEEKKTKTTNWLDLKDPENDTKKIPDLEQKDCFLITMLSSDFHKMCKDMHKKGAKHIEFCCSKNNISFKCKGEGVETEKIFNIGNNNITIDAPAENLIAHGIYELKYLVYLSKCQGMCEKIQICIKSKFPLFITYTIGSMGRILLVLMPYMEKKPHNYGEEILNYTEPIVKLKETQAKKIEEVNYEDVLIDENINETNEENTESEQVENISKKIKNKKPVEETIESKEEVKKPKKRTKNKKIT